MEENSRQILRTLQIHEGFTQPNVAAHVFYEHVSLPSVDSSNENAPK